MQAHSNFAPESRVGGNPPIPKRGGNAPAQTHIPAMPGWKSDIGRCLDVLVERNLPDVRKAVRGNSPWCGVEGMGWFLSSHGFTRYVKVTFPQGTVLKPVPPDAGKDRDACWISLHEGDFNEEQLAKWIRAGGRPDRMG